MAQVAKTSRPAPYALVDSPTASGTATRRRHGTALAPDADGTTHASSTRAASRSAATGRGRTAAGARLTTNATNVPAAGRQTTEPNDANGRNPWPIERRSPLKADGWFRLLAATRLSHKYPTLVKQIQHGFDAGIQPVARTYTPNNSPSILAHAVPFANIVENEFKKGRYFGPFSKTEVEYRLGPFQTSPLAIIPKPGKPGKFRIVQNFSHPHTASAASSSVNSAIDSSLYPCTWGTFATVCLVIARLPPGSEAAVRDVAEAYRTVPVAPSQWSGLVVRLDGDDRFAIDTANCFGLRSSAGTYGMVADAGADIARALGMGPISKWVDDHLFFRIPRGSITAYNADRRRWAATIAANGGQRHDGGRLWYRGDTLPDDKAEEFDEDASSPLRDFSAATERSPHDATFAYSKEDIDAVYTQLGIPWEESKDIPFANSVPFIGFEWDLSERTVAIPQKKRAKYLATITTWQSQRAHTLEEVQQLYGKLLHASLVLPAGRAYLTCLETMLGLFNNSPFMPRTPPRDTASDLQWWRDRLLRPVLARPIPGPHAVEDPNAFSDASSSVGIGIVVGDRWRAWRLLPGWKTDSREIGWAESVGFELLVLTLLPLYTRGSHVRVYGDNNGVVEGWWKGRSRNRPTNATFKRLHDSIEASGCHVHTRYVRSALNPADGPSRGIFPPEALLLPRVSIPPEVQDFVVDYDAPLTPTEQRLRRGSSRQAALPNPARAHTGVDHPRYGTGHHREPDPEETETAW